MYYLWLFLLHPLKFGICVFFSFYQIQNILTIIFKKYFSSELSFFFGTSIAWIFKLVYIANFFQPPYFFFLSLGRFFFFFLYLNVPTFYSVVKLDVKLIQWSFQYSILVWSFRIVILFFIIFVSLLIFAFFIMLMFNFKIVHIFTTTIFNSLYANSIISDISSLIFYWKIFLSVVCHIFLALLYLTTFDLILNIIDPILFNVWMSPSTKCWMLSQHIVNLLFEASFFFIIAHPKQPFPLG